MAKQPEGAGITWTQETWNPIRGCSRVSEGCRFCYAESIARRFSGPGLAYEGLVRIDAAGKPHEWNGNIKFVEKHLLDPLKWKEPKRIFVNSMSDLFHENVEDDWLEAILQVVSDCPQHEFQVLTKRPERMQKLMSMLGAFHAGERMAMCIGDGETPGYPYVLPNLWLGVSCEDQATADKRIPLLLQTPAAVRFISAEPLLGEIDLRRVLGYSCEQCGLLVKPHASTCTPVCPIHGDTIARRPLDWVIVGGESGPGARSCDVGWVREIVSQCNAANVPVFVKQLGRYPVESREADGAFVPDYEYHFADKKGGDIAEWPGDLQVREFPNA